MADFDVIVIGAGPGGYVASIRCAQLGLKTACVDRWLDSTGTPALGGTCLNVGCIPSKALLDSSHHYHNIGHLLPAHGIEVEGARMDVAKMLARKDKIVSQLTRGIAGLLKKNGVSTFAASATLQGDGKVEITGHDGTSQSMSASHIIIATGSVPIDIPVAKVDGERIVDNVGALGFSEVPPRLGVIGAGVIGLELGSVWNRLGSEVVLLEALDTFLGPADRKIARDAERSFRKQGLDIRLGARVTASEITDSGVRVEYQDSQGIKQLEVDKLIVCVGRRACTDGLGAEQAGLELDQRGRVVVDQYGRTNLTGFYAIGDCTPGPMLAHKASEDGVAVAELIAGKGVPLDHSVMPWVIYTHPEIAWVGATEEELKSDGIAFKSGAFPFAASGRAQGSGDTEGSVKMLVHAETDRILGVHIFGANASELIAEAVTAMAFEGAGEDIMRTIHAHPTLAEALHEAALGTDGRTIHI